jgi:hypothetical protein
MGRTKAGITDDDVRIESSPETTIRVITLQRLEDAVPSPRETLADHGAACGNSEDFYLIVTRYRRNRSQVRKINRDQTSHSAISRRRSHYNAISGRPSSRSSD